MQTNRIRVPFIMIHNNTNKQDHTENYAPPKPICTQLQGKVWYSRKIEEQQSQD